MQPTTVEELARFSAAIQFESLPSHVVDETKRVILDSLGCAIAAVSSPKGSIGIDFGVQLGSGSSDATIIGTPHRASVFGAAFANGELINALDFDAVLPPGHVVPYVLPGALALAERDRRSGRDLLAAVAVAHEISYRVGRAMDYIRDIREGQVSHPPVFGYSSTIFGATSAMCRLLDVEEEVHAHALAIAGSIAPVNSLWSSAHRSQSTTMKALAGVLTQSAFMAANLAASGHRGELEILDDHEFGFPRFIGSGRWDTEFIVDRLGVEWLFPAQQSFKIYPHCRVPAALFDSLEKLMDEHELDVSEIESIHAWGEPQGLLPMWTNRDISHLNDAQFSIPHGIAVSAQRVSPRRRWQDPDVVWSSAVLDLMGRVTFDRHPDYERFVGANPASRPARLEIRARGHVFVDDRIYPRGGRTPDPATFVTTDELLAKFRENAQGVIADSDVQRLLDGLVNLEDVADVSSLMPLTASVGDLA